jgi:hypothetical protein
MSAHQRFPPLRLRPRCSRGLGLALVVLHLLAVAALWAVPLSGALRLLLLALVLASLAHGLWDRVLGRLPWSVREVRWSDQGWSLRFYNGRWRTARLLPSTLVTPRLVVLNFRVHWLRYHHLLLTEAVIGPERLRRLRVRLRIERGAL